MSNPIRPTDDDARALARGLMSDASFATLSVLMSSGAPTVSRIACGCDRDGQPISLVSTLSQHTQALVARPRCALLLGEPGPKGDPLTHPRLTLHATAAMIDRTDPGFEALQKGWLESHPKSRLYIGFADFHFVRFAVSDAFLNGGFGKAFELTTRDLGLEGTLPKT